MPTIDLFNKSADLDEIYLAIAAGTFKVRSKLYVKYTAKCVAEGIVIGGVVTLALFGAAVLVAEAINPTIEETE